MDKEIISCDTATNIYTVKFKKEGQTEEYPHIIHHIDYDRGVILKTEYHILQDGFKATNVSEYSDFIQIDGAWGYRKQVDIIYEGATQLLSTTTKAYSNIQINTGMPDSEFE